MVLGSGTYLSQYEQFVKQANIMMHADAGRHMFVVLYADITDFQSVNDNYGFEEGDRFLSAFQRHIEQMPEICLCARTFSDHFIALARFESTPVPDDIRQQYQLYFLGFITEERPFHPNCTVNVACGFCAVEGDDALIKAVDNANIMRKEAKRHTSTCALWMDNDIREQLRRQRDLNASIQSALRREQFSFYLQPKVDLHTGAIVGAEALARWVKNDGTTVMPNDFVPLMERNDTICALDFSIYKQVCQYQRTRLDREQTVFPISMNMSRLHIPKNDTIPKIRALLEEYNVPPHLLEFELTETMFTEEIEGARTLMQDLHALGVKTSIDDYGTGFTGLRLWGSIAFDTLKLDRSFITDSTMSEDTTNAIISAIDFVSRRMHTTLLCEGSETIEQCLRMRNLGCDIAQGYYFSPPLPPAAFEKLWEENDGAFRLPWANAPAYMTPQEDSTKVNISELYHLRDALTLVTEHTPGDVMTLHLQEDRLQINYYSHGLTKHFGYTREEFLRRTASADNGWGLVYEADRIPLQDIIVEKMRAHEPIEVDFRARYADGSLAWHHFSAQPRAHASEQENEYSGIVTSVNALREAENLMQSAQNRYNLLTEMLEVDVWTFNFITQELHMPYSERISDLWLGGKSVWNIYQFVAAGYIYPDSVKEYGSLFQRLYNGEHRVGVEVQARCASGEYEWFGLMGMVSGYRDGQPVEAMCVAVNINDEKAQRRLFSEMRSKAMRDSLTNLYNRIATQDLIRAALKNPENQSQGVLFMLDLDNFKHINDQYGHLAGDKQLRVVAETLRTLLPGNTIIGRAGGDEFIIYLPGALSEQGAHKAGEEICDAIRACSNKGENAMPLTVSIGAARAQEGDTFESLWQRADAAMYCVKRDQKDGCYFEGEYTPAAKASVQPEGDVQV